jgi:uncharacterized membrane protein
MRIARVPNSANGKGTTMRSVAATAVALAMLPLASPALADVTVCNDFRAAISVALAYEEGGSFASQGWWKVAPGACSDLPFKGFDFFYAGESDWYREGGGRKRDIWGKGRNFYVGKGTFKFDNAEQSRRGARSIAFTKITVDERLRSKPHLVTVRFRSGGTNVEVKAKPASS